jgi:hypothetical protein
MTACNPQTPWRDTGDTTPGAFGAELVGTPIFPERDALCDGASPYGRLYLAHSQAENRHDTVGILIDPTMHNNLALRPRGYPEETGAVNGFARFASYEGCLMAWRRRLVDASIDTGEAPKNYVEARTLLEYCHVYNPAGDTHPTTGVPNRPEVYCDRLLATINRLPLDTEGTMPETITFGRVPPPPVAVRDILAPGVRANGDGWNAMNRDRRNFGVVYHRTVGRSIKGTGDWFHNPGTGLTHYGVGAPTPDAGPDGAVYQWVDPRSRVSPWASGPWENPPGDGRALVAKYGVEAINGDLIAIEISGLYDDPISAKTIGAVAAISAYWADQARVPYHQYPTNPGTGLVFTYWHSEFQAHKPCPGDVVRGNTDDIIQETKAILRRYQTEAVPEPPPVYLPLDPPNLEPWDGSDRRLGTALLWACRREFTARKPTPVLRYADRKSGEVRPPLLVGEKFAVDYWLESGGEPWVLTPTGARVPVKDCTPKLSFDLA